jgi:hypothetical protein
VSNGWDEAKRCTLHCQRGLCKANTVEQQCSKTPRCRVTDTQSAFRKMVGECCSSISDGDALVLDDLAGGVKERQKDG